MTTKQRLTAGSLIQIDLRDGSIAFGRVLGQAQIALYENSVRSGDHMDLDKIFDSPVAFVVPLMDSAVKSGRWKIISRRALEPALLEPRDYFIRDHFTGKYSIYRSSDGATRSASQEECEGLECAAVWDPEHVEERLRDFIAKRPSRLVSQLKAVP